MEHTSLFLNGPKLGIVTSPQDVTGVIGIATFTGIATASFPTSSDGINDGSIELKWYYDGSRILDTSEDSTSNASIAGFTSALGYGSTITISGLDVYDNEKEVYFLADYVPTAYSQPIGTTVTAGTARSTGNAYNELVKSGIATIGISPYIEITSQPEDGSAFGTNTLTYSVDARIVPSGGDLSFQWQFNNEDLSDGNIPLAIENPIDPAAIITITGDDGSSASVDSSQLTTYDGFVTGVTYTITASNDVATKCYAVGGGGGSSTERDVLGGAGGSASGRFTFLKDKTYKLRVGGKGKKGGVAGYSASVGGGGGYSGGGDGGGGHGKGGGGGGFTGLFIDSISQSNAILIAGGGGGGANYPSPGGMGGGLIGGDATAPWESNQYVTGKGGTQSAGGKSGRYYTMGPEYYHGQDGSALQGGSAVGVGVTYSISAGGGGGGYYGGGGGAPYNNLCCKDGGGGGGSSFFHSTLIRYGETTSGSANDPITDGSFRFEILNTVDEKDWSAEGTVTNAAPANAAGNGPIKNAFDGSLTYYWTSIPNEISKYTFPSIVTGTKFEIYMSTSLGNTNFSVNGQSSSSVPDSGNAPGWKNVTDAVTASGLGGLSYITVVEVANAYSQAVYAIRVDGKMLVDPTYLTIAGSQTKTLSITATSARVESYIGSIRCKVTADGVQKSPVYSRSASWVLLNRNLLKYEVVDEENAILSHVGEQNLDDGLLSLSYSDISSGNLMSLNHNSEQNPRNQLIIVYPPEKDLSVTITIAGAVGSENGNRGGPGGVSSFEFVLKNNTEYVFLVGPGGVSPSPGGGYGAGGGTFFYRGSQIIACVGGGGGGGPCGVGGRGGGINMSGTYGTGGAAGLGGVRVEQGQLPTRGYFPGSSETSYTPFFKTEDAMEGGRVSACTWGSWYINRAYSPCKEIGTVYFRGNDGTENTSTAKIKRSYKPGPGGGSAEEGQRGWIYRFNGGNGGWGESVGYNGDGGGGAIGGQGGHRSHSGGGGGSGFSNGEPTNVKNLDDNTSSGYFKIELNE